MNRVTDITKAALIKAGDDADEDMPDDELLCLVARHGVLMALQFECAFLARAMTAMSVGGLVPMSAIRELIRDRNGEDFGEEHACTLESLTTQPFNGDVEEVKRRAISRHPLTLYRDQAARVPHIPARLLGRHVGRRVTTIGWLVTAKMVTSKDDEPMEFVSFEDTTALYETTFFPEAYRRFRHMLSHTEPYVLRGRVEEDFGAITMTIDGVEFLRDVRAVSVFSARPGPRPAARR